MDFNLWNIVKLGFQKSSKLMNEWNNLENKIFSLKARAMNTLFCVLDKNEFNHISLCENVYEI